MVCSFSELVPLVQALQPVSRKDGIVRSRLLSFDSAASGSWTVRSDVIAPFGSNSIEGSQV